MAHALPVLVQGWQGGEIAACECRSWWRAWKRGRWYAISKRRAFRALLPELMRELSYYEMTGRWPTDAA